MPAGETTEQHRRLQQEEAEIVELDKVNHTAGGEGLFKGRFRYFARARAPVIRDIQDGVDRCPHCSWELEEGECGTCGYPNVTDDMASLSGSLSEGISYLEDEELAERGIDEQRGLLGLEDEGSELDYFSDTDISFTEIANRSYANLEAEEIRAMRRMRRLTAGDRTRGRILGETDEERSSADDEGAGSLDGFVVDDAEEGPNPPAREHSIRDQWTPPYGLSPSIGSSHTSSPSTHYDIEGVIGIDEDTGTYPPDEDGSSNESRLGQIDFGSIRNRGTRLGRSRTRQSQARARPRPESSRLNQNDHNLASASHESTQEEMEDDSDDAPIVRTRRRAPTRRYNIASSSDSDRSFHLPFSMPNTLRHYRQHNIVGRASPGFSPLHSNPSRNERGSGSSNGTSRGVPIEIESDSDAPVRPRRSRVRRTVNEDFSDDNQTSTADITIGVTRGSQSSSGTATVGRQSPAQGTTAIRGLLPPNQKNNTVSPILIESSPPRQEECQHDSPTSQRNDFPGSPDLSHNQLVPSNPSLSPSASAHNSHQSPFHIPIPPRPFPRHRQRTHRIPSRSPRHPSRNSPGPSFNSASLQQAPANEILAGAEQRHQQAADDEAARKAARKAEKKRLKRERRQREQSQVAAASAVATVGGDAFGRRW